MDRNFRLRAPFVQIAASPASVIVASVERSERKTPLTYTSAVTPLAQLGRDWLR